MNIFFLDYEPAVAARYHCNSHVVKMCLEYAQLLCTAHRVIDPSACLDRLYKPTHKNHPSAVWVRDSKFHYEWLFELFAELSKEYQYRYGREHLSWTKLGLELSQPPRSISNGRWSNPPQCMPDEFKNDVSTIQAYRDYYKYGKAHILKYTKRGEPSWLST